MSHSWNNGGRVLYSPLSVKYKGLVNQGATCYLNSVLQVLFMTEDFREAVERYPGTEYIDLQLKTLFDELKNQTADTFQITDKLDIKQVYEQRDAAEYFGKILNLTSDEPSQIFYGKMSNRTECSACETQTDTEMKFWHLPLTLWDSSNTVVNSVKEYFKPMSFSGENRLYCDKCDAKRDATVRCVIKTNPEVLMLLLKRFELDYSTKTLVKNNCNVSFPHTLTIPENQLYELYAVVDHVGDLRSGHYTSTIKSSEDGRWYMFDDGRVTLLDYQPDQTENSESAYLLFYRKQKAPASEDIRGVFTPGDYSTLAYNQRQDTVMVNKEVKVDPDRQRSGLYSGSYGVKTGAEKVEPKGRKLLTKFDLLFNNTQVNSAQSTVREDQAWKRGSSSRYDSQDQHRNENIDVQRVKEVTKREDEHLQKGTKLRSTYVEDTDRRSSDDTQISANHSILEAVSEEEMQEDEEYDEDRDISFLSQTEGEEEEYDEDRDISFLSQTEGEEEDRKSQPGTCIVRIYEEEKRIMPSVTLRSREKMDIKLQTLQATFINRGEGVGDNREKGNNDVFFGGEDFQSLLKGEVRNKRITLDVRHMLAKLSQENKFDMIQCHSPVPHNIVT
ncbi:uncharacterized protein LOC117807073 isoform X2 [Xyrichtys novacula]|uniref:Ubiquitin carboxyl-terminal hydrolase n=1 Tax=Xyrichtys novacula TaxID=13765 RepID=A0AAV1HKK5_XYRNO|nr:uncharacterized protein LOC117807073 isoform X2 [Xyrichtys novacula]